MLRRPPTRASIVATLAATIVGVGVGAVSTARGQAPSFAIAWDAPAADCPDEAYVRRGVEQLLGGGDAAPATARVEAHARVERLADRQWRVHLTTHREGATGERVVDSISCRSLADATALIVALTIDPQRVAANRGGTAATSAASGAATSAAPLASGAAASSASAPAAASAPAPASTPAPAPALAPALAPAPAPAPESAAARPPFPPTRFAVLAAVAGDLGTLPQPAYGFVLGAALLFSPFRVEAYGAYWPSQTAHAAITPTAGGDVFLAGGGARGCWVPLGGRLEIAACPGLEIGLLHGQGKGVRSPAPNEGLWLATTALGRTSWRIAPSFAVFLEAGLAVPFFRDRFTLDASTIHQAAAVEGRAAVGPELRF